MIVLMLLNAVLLAVLPYMLEQRFRSTRNGGYLVRGVPLVLWSFVWWSATRTSSRFHPCPSPARAARTRLNASPISRR